MTRRARRDVVARQRVDRIGDLLLRQPAHLGDHLRELAEIAVEDALGVVGHIHDLVAAIGACITGARIQALALRRLPPHSRHSAGGTRRV